MTTPRRKSALAIAIGLCLLSACVPFPDESANPANPAIEIDGDAATEPDAAPDGGNGANAAATPSSTVPASSVAAPSVPPSATTVATGADTSEAVTSESAVASIAPPAVGPLDWGDCRYANNLECATLSVPVEYADPSLGTIDIAIARHPANNPKQRIGVLLINPGGPGVSGIEFAAGTSEGGFFSKAILDRFDIIGWDPRGVGDSEPEFACGTDEQWISAENAIEDYIDTPEEEQIALDAVKLCETSMGPAAMRLGSYYVAQDMDQIRIALGEEQISYYGASYGSAIGVWYATLFPDRVRAMVVDGADNPVDDLTSDEAILQSSLEEWQALEDKMREALEACDSADCPIYNGGDPIGFYFDHVDDLQLVNDEFGGNPDAGFLAVITPLYNERQWPLLWSGLAAVAQGDPGPLAQLADRQLMGEEGASDTGHINCLDGWALGQQVDAQEQLRLDRLVDDELRERLPLLWALPYGQSFCAQYRTEVPPAFDRPFDGGGAPIVVIGNLSDPVTPFTESEELVDTQLSNGYLVVADYPAHVVYPDTNCVARIVDQALIDQTLPAERRTECGKR